MSSSGSGGGGASGSGGPGQTRAARGRLRLGVLVSGSGTNLQAVLDAIAAGTLDAEVTLVLSNRPGVQALDRARAAGVAARVLPHEGLDRSAYDAALVQALRDAGVELVVLAGFMRVVTSVLLGAFPDRVLNIHPSLLPAFPGVNAQEQALAHGVKVSGCTVHLVVPEVDTGPILVQAAVPVRESDDEARLRARILRQEHRILPLAIRLLGEGRVQRVEGSRRLRIDTQGLTVAPAPPTGQNAEGDDGAAVVSFG
ncbi:MAG TPA: phosphoribosylglycinamide formyltransferase [Myxococcota bacterium]|jgi:phosphoribosylglycinamide formyltransferase-1|nr:phosphoribosylglycinamide formyltransferase [Myxococcota bacterium]